MPAVQLQVAMGIPLSNIPDIRRFYGRADAAVGDPIDFLKESTSPSSNHVIAARITAENPDEGLKPTSGKIERVSFQSTPKVWGYFSVGANGGIHEFADSQFGHLFASGPTREIARRNLVIALAVEIRGHIRNPVDYLVQLARDGRLQGEHHRHRVARRHHPLKSVRVELRDDADVVLAAATSAPSRASSRADQGRARGGARQGPTSGRAQSELNAFPTSR